MKKICFITPYCMNPPAPRILMEKSVLIEHGFNADIVYPNCEMSIFKRNLYLLKQFKIIYNNYDTFIVYDLLTLLFLAIFIKQKNISHKIIYEVLDSFPEYYSYKLKKNIFINSISTKFLEKIEKFIVKKCVNKVIVNSPALKTRFDTYGLSVYPLLYTSPFEKKNFNNDFNLPTALIYIGQFSIEKGADEILAIANKNKNLKIFIIGDSNIAEISDFENIIYFNRVNPDKLFEILFEISKKYFLFGISLIKSSNKSYEMQEANKDIDYLSLGIPILGNKRIATYDKIKKGAGIVNTDSDYINKLQDNHLKQVLSKKAKQLYLKLYSNKIFKENLINACS